MEQNLEIKGYIDVKRTFSKYEFFNEENFLGELKKSKNILDNGIICIGDLGLRKKIIEIYSPIANFTSVVSSFARISEGVSLEKGVVVMPSSTVRVGSLIGKHCIVNTGAIVEHHCIIGANCHIGPGAVLCGNVSTGDNVLVGAGAIVLPGTHIKSDTIVPAGSRWKS